MKYYNIEKKYLALSLSYLGFKFYIFDNVFIEKKYNNIGCFLFLFVYNSNCY